MKFCRNSACPTGNSNIADSVREAGLDNVILSTPLFLDPSESAGWQDWFDLASLDLGQSQKGLSIADSNSRVQAVIDGQGIALWDQLVTPEVNSGQLQPFSDIWLDGYGYYVLAREGDAENVALRLFLDRLVVESGVS